MIIEWSEDFSVGIEMIDTQHKQLVAIANQLSGAVSANVDDQRIADILERLADYVGHHFGCEEEVMRQMNYPWLDLHKAQHEELIQGLAKLIYDFEKGSIKISADTMRFVNEWVTVHILDHDRRIGDYARQHGHRV